MIEKRLNTVEETLAHQEQQIDVLSQMVSQQWEVIDGLKKGMKNLQNKIDRIDDSDSKTENKDSSLSSLEQAALNKPPHY